MPSPAALSGVRNVVLSPSATASLLARALYAVANPRASSLPVRARRRLTLGMAAALSCHISWSASGLRGSRQLPAKFVCRRAKVEVYEFPDPIPEFAEQETNKFREHMSLRLEQKKDDYFGEHVEEIVDICTEILGSFLKKDYRGPGTLLVNPFLDMKGEIKERGLPGSPQAARAAIAWAEKNIDKDWRAWTGEA